MTSGGLVCICKNHPFFDMGVHYINCPLYVRPPLTRVETVTDLQELIEREGEPDLCPCGKGYLGHEFHGGVEI